MGLSPHVRKLANLAKAGLASADDIDALIAEVQRCTLSDVMAKLRPILSGFESELHAELATPPLPPDVPPVDVVIKPSLSRAVGQWWVERF